MMGGDCVPAMLSHDSVSEPEFLIREISGFEKLNDAGENRSKGLNKIGLRQGVALRGRRLSFSIS